MLLALDVGNTHVVVGLMEGCQVRRSFRIATRRDNAVGDYAVALSQLLELAEVDRRDVEQVIISSVVPPVTRAMQGAARLLTGGEPLVKKNIISICKNCAGCNCLRLPADGKIKPRLHSNDEFFIKGLSYDEMLAAFRQAIAAKPARHAVLSAQCRSEAGRNMNQIRG